MVLNSGLTFESRGIDMRAIQMEQFGDPAQVLRVVDIEEPPPPGPHEVLLSVEVSPLNKHDLLVVGGMLARPPLPHIPGAEGVARVLATGAEVDGLQVGDLVVLPLYAGAWRERLVVPADSLFALPAGGSIEQYSMLGSNPPTAGLMLSECTPLQPGDWVVQNAANSGVGRSLIALAKLRGLKTINLARDDATFAELTAAGADVVHVDDPDAVGDVRAVIGDARVVLAVEAVGGPLTPRHWSASTSPSADSLSATSTTATRWCLSFVRRHRWWPTAPSLSPWRACTPSNISRTRCSISSVAARSC
jgi:NADPH:quinone reductase-like Zn-dependent oxidoreductase